ncbi:hypothetical protein CW704_05110 [Candidatus Bathyarchaeota archaeon]|nr:MAG: hypothetical protein CW704_05110 [Candidatus Bathyarchaeota archaeon]
MKRVIGKKTSMSPSVHFIQVEKEKTQDDLFKHLERIFSAASSIDALKIFYTAKDGIESSTQTIKKLNLTQKRYYTNLKRLIDAGLVEKVDGKYVHTTFGKISYKLLEAFKNAVDKKDKLDLIDRLLKTKNLSVEETEEIMKALLKDVSLIPGGQITDILGPVRIVETWEKVVQEVIEYINKAEEEILFASRYYDTRIMEACLIAAQRHVETYYLVDKELKVSSVAQIFLRSLFTNHDDVLNDFFNFLKSSLFKIKYASLPYSFLVIDKEYSMVEVSKPLGKTFSLAFTFHNKRLSERLSESFKELWERGVEINLLNQNRQE